MELWKTRRREIMAGAVCLLLLIAALVGEDWRRIYDYALSHDFRFLSYGDSSLLLP